VSDIPQRSEDSRSSDTPESDPQIEPAYVPNWENEPASDELFDEDVLKRVKEADAELAHDNGGDDD
jgi:hypothetical protein